MAKLLLVPYLLCLVLYLLCWFCTCCACFRTCCAGSVLTVSGSVLAVSGSVLAMPMSCEQLGLPPCPLHSVVCHLLPAISLPHVNGLHNVISG